VCLKELILALKGDGKGSGALLSPSEIF